MGREEKARREAERLAAAEFERLAGPVKAFQKYKEKGCPKCTCGTVFTEHCAGSMGGQGTVRSAGKPVCPYPGEHLHRICHQNAGGCGYHWIEKCADDPTSDQDGYDDYATEQGDALDANPRLIVVEPSSGTEGA